MKLTPSAHFQPIQEWDDAFLALFPHRYDYLWADHPTPVNRPDWKTESRHPLSDRLIQQGTYLYGVRFGSTTRYILLDIDKGSLYHPSRDRFAWRRLVQALEPLGLVQVVSCTSSYSGGLHLYFPFGEEQKTWAIAQAVSTLLENAGFKLVPGQLEVFPNCKPYSPTGESSLYNGHRLPMQAGSYLLNEDLQMVWGNQETFGQYWQFAQQRNSIDEKLVERIIRASRRREYRITRKAEKFLNDLNAEIERGWTGKGQTNRLLGRITMRSYIFGHLLHASTPLEGEALVENIVTTAQALPGYEEWCQHQHEIEKRVRDWVAAIERSHYFHYGKDKPHPSMNRDSINPVEQGWNQQQSLSARERIRQALADLLNKGALPAGIKERVKALASYGISGSTLYKHRDLWHPQCLEEPKSGEPHMGMGQDSLKTATCPNSPTSLLERNGCNPLPGGGYSPTHSAQSPPSGCNPLPDVRLRGFQDVQRQQQLKKEQSKQRQIARMQSYLDSGDPILVAEALNWDRANPGVLQFNQLRLPIA